VNPDDADEAGASFLIAGGSKQPLVTPEALSQYHALYGFKLRPACYRRVEPSLQSGHPYFCGVVVQVLCWCGREISINRLKTLFDAMRIPEAGERYADRTPSEDEKPFFFCLLEDDKLLNKVSVETDDLLHSRCPARPSSILRMLALW